MSLEQIALLSEIISALAIIVTLFYLAIQIKDSGKASRSEAITGATTGLQSFYQELGNNPETSNLFLHGLKDPDSFSREKQFQFIMLMHSVFLAFQRSFFLASEGTLDVALRDSIGTAIHAINHLPGAEFYWRQRKSFFQPEFVTWVESLLLKETFSDMEVYVDKRSADENNT